MVSILDLVPVPEIVRVRGKDLPVHGFNLESFTELVARFPEVAEFFASGANPKAFLRAAPKIAAMIIGAAIGQDSPEELAAIRKLPLGDAVALLLAVQKGTMPDGPGPFEELLERAEPLIRKFAEQAKAALSTSSGEQPSASPGEAESPSPQS